VTDEERIRRISANEAVFRTLNEQIEGLNRSLAALSDQMMHAVCECGDISCAQPIVVPVKRYEEVRADPLLFFVVPGHEIPDVETVVEETSRYNVVRKDKGTPARSAERLMPPQE
jgi:hypothetical protein